MSQRAGLDRDQIIQTAAKMADEWGLEQVTIANLAKKLGVRSPSLYNHVNGLQEIRLLLAVHALQLLQQQMTCALADRSSGSASSSPEETIHALGKAYLDFARTHPGLYEAGLLRAMDKEHQEIQRQSEKLVGLFVNTLAQYELQGDEAIHAVRGLRCLFHGFATLEQQGGFGIPVDPDASFVSMIDTFLSGLQLKSERTQNSL